MSSVYLTIEVGLNVCRSVATRWVQITSDAASASNDELATTTCQPRFSSPVIAQTRRCRTCCAPAGNRRGQTQSLPHMTLVTELQLSAAWGRCPSAPSSPPKPMGSTKTPPLGSDRLRDPAAASRPLVVPIARQYPTVSTGTRHRRRRYPHRDPAATPPCEGLLPKPCRAATSCAASSYGSDSCLVPRETLRCRSA